MGFTPSLLKKRMTECCSSLMHSASGAASFTLLLRRRVASYYHMSATLQTMSITVVNLQDSRTVFRVFIALLRFSFDSPSFCLVVGVKSLRYTPNCVLLCIVYVDLCGIEPRWHQHRLYGIEL